jgi:hypothetical protein
MLLSKHLDMPRYLQQHYHAISSLLSATLHGFVMSFLKVSGTKIVNEKGEEVVLKGAGLGGWMLYVFSFIILHSLPV